MKTLDLDTLTLSRGAHQPDGEFCLLEAVAYIAREPWTDHPACVCPVLAAFGRTWNDGLPDGKRDELLKPFILKLIGTRTTPDVQVARTFMAADWSVRVHTPVWLRAAGLDLEAVDLEALPTLTSTESCEAAIPTIKNAGSAAADAARHAAADWDATAWDAAADAAWDAAAGYAVADAAAYTARHAATSAVADAAAYTARHAATSAAAYTAGYAARDAAGEAPWDAVVDAAGDAARAVFAPYVAVLQASAVDLYDRMIAVTA